MRKTYASTLMAELAVMACQLVVYKLAAGSMGKEGFSEYALARRAVALLQPAVMMGQAVAIPRYMALCSGEGSSSGSRGYFSAGLFAIILSVGVMLIVLNALRRTVAFLFFGSTEFDFLVFPLSLVVAGLVLHTACYSYFRGKLDMTRANILQLFNMGLIPLFVFPFFGKTVNSFLIALGSFLGLSSMVALLFTKIEIPSRRLLTLAKELLGYGAGRVPADFIQLAFLTLPAIFIVHARGVVMGGFTAFGISILTMAASVFVPIGAVLLPEASQMIGRGDFASLKRRMSQILRLSSILLIVLVAGVLLFAPTIVRLYLGSSFLDVVDIIRIIAPAALPYSIYVCSKVVIDASSAKPLNTKNILIAFSFFVVSSTIVLSGRLSSLYVLVFLVLGLYSLGLLTLLELKKIFARG